MGNNLKEAKIAAKKAAALEKVNKAFDKKFEDNKKKFDDKIASLDKSKDDYQKKKDKLLAEKDKKHNLLKAEQKDEKQKIDKKLVLDDSKIKRQNAIRKVELQFKEDLAELKDKQKTAIDSINNSKIIPVAEKPPRIDDTVEKFDTKEQLLEIKKQEKIDEIKEKYEDKKEDRSKSGYKKDKSGGFWDSFKQNFKSSYSESQQITFPDGSFINGDCVEYVEGCHKVIHSKDRAFYFQDNVYLPSLSELMNRLGARYQFIGEGCVGSRDDIIAHILRNVPNVFVNGDYLCNLDNKTLYRWGFENGGDFSRRVMTLEELNSSEIANYLPGPITNISFNGKEFILECLDKNKHLHSAKIMDGTKLFVAIRWGKPYEYDLTL